jgi:hypothetical protein
MKYLKIKGRKLNMLGDISRLPVNLAMSSSYVFCISMPPDQYKLLSELLPARNSLPGRPSLKQVMNEKKSEAGSYGYDPID